MNTQDSTNKENGATTFADFIAAERERLNGERGVINEQIAVLNEQGSVIDNELRAISAYETAKTGVPVAPVATRRGRRQAQAGQGRRGSKREGLLKLIRENPAGLKRADILEKMGLKGDKSGEMSVSNALTALVKNNTVSRSDGKYVAAAVAA